jgi:NTP pyrophosphatase (non-canonical NTP hydrolase)
MTDGLRRRGMPDLAARVAAELGALVLAIAYERWIETTEEFGDVVRRTLGEVQAAGALC